MFRQATRRDMLRSAATGFGYMAFADLARQAVADATNPLAVKACHHPARAKRIIFLFMHGGPSQVDTFDHKPRLDIDDGKDLPFEPAVGTKTSKKIMKSPWKFARHGQSGLWASELFPEVAKHVDKLCMLNGMHTWGQSHGQAVLQLHTGAQNLTRPSMGSWVTYGLGTENQNLPGFVTICPTRGHGGAQNYGSAFLPAAFQGTTIGHASQPASNAQIRYVGNGDMTLEQRRQQLGFLQQMNREHLRRSGNDDRIDAVIESFELAFRMQAAAPGVTDLHSETKATLDLYGVGQKPTDDFGRQCLLARRFAEAGVRYIQVSHSFKWDQHGALKIGHDRNAREVDKPIAGLLTDLDKRGLLKDTLVLWGGEFGRTPTTEGKDGRDHNPQGFTMWLAGGGVKPGFHYGSTDDFGYHAVQDKVSMYDLHATILWLLGLNHEKLTYRHLGRDFRLTDVHGRVVRPIFA